MSRTSIGIVIAWSLVIGLVIGGLFGHDLGIVIGEKRTIACTLFCQRGAAQEYGVIDLDSCTCYGDVRELVRDLDHIDTGFAQKPAINAD